MNTDILKGKWKTLKGEAKEQWGKLTDDDLREIEGEAEQLVGKLQEAYGFKKAEAEKKVDAFLAAHS